MISGDDEMSQNIGEICEQLKLFSEMIKDKNKYEKIINTSKKSYLKKEVKIKKPKLKIIKEVELPREPERPNIKKGLVSGVSIAAGSAAIFGVIVLSVVGGLGSAFAVIVGVAAEMTCIAVPSMIVSKKETAYKVAEEKYQSDLKKAKKLAETNKKNKEYNANYQELMEQYETEVKAVTEEYEKEQEVAKIKLNEITEKISAYEGIISPKFHNNIDDIITIIEDGRADSIKEAINIFISDSKQNELIEEQRKRNKIAEQKMENEMYHNMVMANEARRQADVAERQLRAMKEQEEARRRGAPSCWQCKNWPCGGDPAYCGSFAKKD